MKAAITAAPRGAISVENVEEPERRSGWVMVDLALALITATDATTYSAGDASLFPRVQGGGGVGILATGGGSLIVGTRVAIWPVLACGRCVSCVAGWRDGCVDTTLLGTDRDGTLAEHVVVPRDNAVQMPGGVSPDAAAAAIEYADAWRLLQEATGGTRGRNKAIVGSDSTARAAHRIAERMTGDVVAVDAPDALGEGEAFDAIIACGSPVDGLVDHLAIDGTLVIGDPVETASISTSTLAERRARVIAARPAGRQDFAEALRWITDEEFRPPVDAPVQLDAVSRAFDRAADIADPVPVVID